VHMRTSYAFGQSIQPIQHVKMQSTSIAGRIAGAVACAQAILLDYRADIEAKAEKQATPLHIATQEGRIDAIKVLLAYRADIEARAVARSATGSPLAECWKKLVSPVSSKIRGPAEEPRQATTRLEVSFGS